VRSAAEAPESGGFASGNGGSGWPQRLIEAQTPFDRLTRPTSSPRAYTDPVRSALLLVLGGVLAVSSSAGAQQLSLSLADGRATLHADGVTARQILDEWASRADVHIEGAERLPAEPLTLQLDNRPEAEVLEIVLRSASGVILARRPPGSSGASAIDRILILPVSSASAAPVGPPPMGPMSPAMTPPAVYVPAPMGQPPGAEFDQVPPDEQPAQDGSEPPFPPPTLTPAGPPPSIPVAVPIAPSPSDATATPTGPLIISQPGVIPVPQQPTTPGVPPVPSPPQQ
jgi:hypothetical protein